MKRVLAAAVLALAACAPPDETGSEDGSGAASGSTTRSADDVLAVDLARVPEAPVREALNRARDAVVAAPDSAEAWGRYGDWLQQYSYDEEAAVCYAAAGERDPTEFLWPYRRACVLGDNHPESALAALQRAFRLEDSYAPAEVRRAALERELGQDAAARAALERALALDSTLASAHLALARLELSGPEPARARAHLEVLAATHPGNREVHELLARMHQALGDPAAAQQQLTLARDLPRASLDDDPRARPDLPPVSSRDHINAGARLAAQQRYAEATQHFQEALRLNPASAEAAYNLAQTYVSSELPDDAIRVLREGLTRDPHNALLGVKLGELLILQERYDEAVALFEDLVARTDSWLAHKQLGFLYGHAGRVAESTEQTTRALELNPENAELWFDHGLQVQSQQGRAAAIPEFQKALALDPSLHKARYRLAVALLAEERFPEGIAELEELLRRRPEHPDAPASLLFAYERAAGRIAAQDPAQAIAYYDAVLARRPDPTVQRKLAWLLATHPDPTVRDPVRALALADAFAPEGTEDAARLGARAAALAINDRYPEAVDATRRARQAALDGNQQRLARRLRDQLTEYKARRPYLEQPMEDTGGTPDGENGADDPDSSGGDPRDSSSRTP